MSKFLDTTGLSTLLNKIESYVESYVENSVYNNAKWTTGTSSISGDAITEKLTGIIVSPRLMNSEHYIKAYHDIYVDGTSTPVEIELLFKTINNEIFVTLYSSLKYKGKYVDDYTISYNGSTITIKNTSVVLSYTTDFTEGKNTLVTYLYKIS